MASSRTTRHTVEGRREEGNDVGDGGRGRGRGWEMKERRVIDELRGI